MADWDTTAFRVAAMAPNRFRDAYHAASGGTRDDLLRMRLRWRVGEFADLCVRPIVEAAGEVWYPDCDFQRQIYSVLPQRSAQRRGVRQRLVLGPRGIAKTSTGRTRAFHSAVFGLDRLQLAIAYNDPKAMQWVEPVAAWCRDKPAIMGQLWPRLTASGDQHNVRVSGENGASVLVATGFRGGGTRGTNVGAALARPTQIFLDDVEVEENSATRDSRQATVHAIHGKVRNSVPLQGAADIWWLQTPIGPDTGASRRVKGDPDLAAWDLIRCPAVRTWPTSPLWDAARDIFRDLGHGSAQAREQAVLAFYDLHRAEMSAGADVLDEVRLPIERAYLTRWTVGESVWAKDFDVLPRALTGRIFDTSSWPSATWLEGRHKIALGERVYDLTKQDRRAHWDPSDGGDAGGFAAGFADPAGRLFLLSLLAMESMRKTDQIIAVVRECARLRVRFLQFERNSLDSAGERALREEVAKVEAETPGWRLYVDGLTTSENKETRVSNLEPRATNHMLVRMADASPVALAQFDDFNPAKTNNADDVPDAVQRLDEMFSTHDTPRMGSWSR